MGVKKAIKPRADTEKNTYWKLTELELPLGYSDPEYGRINYIEHTMTLMDITHELERIADRKRELKRAVKDFARMYLSCECG